MQSLRYKAFAAADYKAGIKTFVFKKKSFRSPSYLEDPFSLKGKKTASDVMYKGVEQIRRFPSEDVE